MPEHQTLIAIAFNYAAGVIALMLFGLRKSSFTNLACITAGSTAFTITIGAAYFQAQMPVSLDRMQQAFIGQSQSGQTLMSHYFAVREHNGFTEPISNAEFDALLKQIQKAAPPPAGNQYKLRLRGQGSGIDAIPAPEDTSSTTEI